MILKGKHCGRPIAVMGVADTFSQWPKVALAKFLANAIFWLFISYWNFPDANSGLFILLVQFCAKIAKKLH